MCGTPQRSHSTSVVLEAAVCGAAAAIARDDGGAAKTSNPAPANNRIRAVDFTSPLFLLMGLARLAWPLPPRAAIHGLQRQSIAGNQRLRGIDEQVEDVSVLRPQK